MTAFYQEDRSGELLYLFCKELSKISRLVAYGIDDENKFIVSTKEYYMELIRLLLDHLEEHKKIYYSIILSNRNSLVVDIILDTTIKDINRRLNISNIDRKSVPADVIINFYLGAVSLVGLNYLKSDNKYSKQDIINYLSVLIPDNI